MVLKQILFIRHGQTDWNNEMRYQGQSDVPLNAEGLEQADRLSLRLCSCFQADLIVTSPLCRAHRTAEIIAMRQKKDQILVREDLKEIGFGKWEGLTVSEVKKRFPDEHDQWRKDPSTVIPGDGESFEAVRLRVASVLEEILQRDEEQIMVVAHGGAIRTALVDLLKVNSSLVWHMRLDNCSISSVHVFQSTIMLAFLNDATHLYVPKEFIRYIPLSS
ncbi:alpha-ribazole phosphatase [Aminobacterium sp. MB27-C1]|jgi:alpha-ribazole phosphatase|uniref:alpha-ribazole phosphatase n=1 Tax=Aminobacterium sp. MB27-C1 TaxID=3070661 RepID=UPI001BCFFF5E|nr:alpha-ribazole phosphatase [Aminobacterium sp. MB27-C1]MDD2207101.1 alpha-ribazole phosphatase [Aminobacterium sp.]MDD3707462.1 alpha-ribazole phosphatase [Aminobacterium sp.]MDD4228804.1 alpha-ribazole phosphatase [Aminobacterium sp.]MDD4550577.1 alpha-ribazole phosphatase [Aminobacterium sp.]WMI71945.1 alpha-ribazole phosphatase [Aminobacterium sp. MB27-C1]